MRKRIHFIIASLLTLLLISLHDYLKSGAYDFTNDKIGEALTIKTVSLTSITSEERCVNDLKVQIPCRQLQDIQTGDIMITKSSFTLLYRHGHIALVVDAEKELVIEALGYGNASALASLEKWNYYPTVQVLRLKDTDPETIEQITFNALEQYLDIPYSIFATGTNSSRTHCSALIWKIFYEHGYDLNSTGGRIVTPQGIMNSPYLEIIESYGFGSNQKTW